MSYVDPDFTNTYKKHFLVRLPSMPNLDAFQLVEPGSGWMQSTVITFYGPRPEFRQICITGDLCPGTHGILSNWGYGLDWFGTDKSESYLCEKFLRQEWRPEKCLAWLECELSEERKMIAAGEYAENDDDYREAQKHVEKLQAIIFEWEELLEEEGQTGIYHRMFRDLGQGSVDDGMPGLDYNPRDAGLLCAAQQAFARLLPMLPQEEREPVVSMTRSAYEQMRRDPQTANGKYLARLETAILGAKAKYIGHPGSPAESADFVINSLVKVVQDGRKF